MGDGPIHRSERRLQVVVADLGKCSPRPSLKTSDPSYRATMSEPDLGRRTLLKIAAALGTVGSFKDSYVSAQAIRTASADAGFGLGVHSTSKVPDCGFSRSYHIDLLRSRFRASPPRLALENCRRINGQILKTALSALNARPGRVGGDSTGPQLRGHGRQQRSRSCFGANSWRGLLRCLCAR